MLSQVRRWFKKREVLPYEPWWVAFADAQEVERMWTQPESVEDKRARWGANVKTGALALAAVALVSHVGLVALEQAHPLDHWLQDLIGIDDQGTIRSAVQSVDGSVYLGHEYTHDSEAAGAAWIV